MSEKIAWPEELELISPLDPLSIPLTGRLKTVGTSIFSDVYQEETSALQGDQDSGEAARREHQELLSLEETLKQDPFNNKIIYVGNGRQMTLGHYLYWHFGTTGELPDSFAIREANTLAGYPPDHLWADNVLNRNRRVKREYVMDRLAEEAIDITGNEFDADKVIDHLNNLLRQRARLTYLRDRTEGEESSFRESLTEQEDFRAKF